MTHSEAIQEARRRKDAGEFYCKIVARHPEDLHYSRFDLACGHQFASASGAVIGRSRRGSAELPRVLGRLDQGAFARADRDD